MAPPLLTTDRRPAQHPPGRAVTVTGWLMALWCVVFAVVNVGFEATGRFTGDDDLADISAAISVMNWLVVGLKLVGAAVALLSVARRTRRPSPTLLAVLLWGAFATLAVYSLGSVAQAAGMLLGLMGGADRIDPASVAYVLFFLFAAAGFGVLSVSHLRRHTLGRWVAVAGMLGAPLLLGLILVAAPALLEALGILPAS